MVGMVEVDRLVKRFGPLTAVDGVSFDVAQGEVLGFLGPNGAGKSTTLRMIAGFLMPTEGTVRVTGHDVGESPIAAKAQIGYLPEGAPSYPDMTPIAFLNFIAKARGLSRQKRRERIDYVIHNMHLEPVLEQRIETLSKGFNRRVMVAQAILHDPAVLLLDEPSDGLDPNQKHELRSFITEMARDKAIIISTHDLEEVETVCSRAIIIAQGSILADGTVVEELERRSPLYNAVLITTSADYAAEVLAGLDVVSRVQKLGGDRYRVYPTDGAAILERVSKLAKVEGWRVAHLSVDAPRLDDVFRELTVADHEGASVDGAAAR